MGFRNFVKALVAARADRAQAVRAQAQAPAATGAIHVDPITTPFTWKRSEFFPVQSSNVAAIGYDHVANLMRIEFKRGATYEYEHVGDRALLLPYWEDFKAAPSKGKWVAHVLRPLSRGGLILYRKIAGDGGAATGRRLFHYEPKQASEPGGYKPGGPLPISSRLGRLLGEDRRARRERGNR